MEDILERICNVGDKVVYVSKPGDKNHRHLKIGTITKVCVVSAWVKPDDEEYNWEVLIPSDALCIINNI